MLGNWENRIPVPKNPTAVGKGFTSATQFFFSNTETESQGGLVPSYPLLTTPYHTFTYGRSQGILLHMSVCLQFLQRLAAKIGFSIGFFRN